MVSLTQLVQPDYLEQLKKMGLQWGWEQCRETFCPKSGVCAGEGGVYDLRLK